MPTCWSVPEPKAARALVEEAKEVEEVKNAEAEEEEAEGAGAAWLVFAVERLRSLNPELDPIPPTAGADQVASSTYWK